LTSIAACIKTPALPQGSVTLCRILLFPGVLQFAWGDGATEALPD